MRVQCVTFKSSGSVFLKVDVACNGDQPVRIIESTLQPSKAYQVIRQSEVDKWNWVRHAKRYKKVSILSLTFRSPDAVPQANCDICI